MAVIKAGIEIEAGVSGVEDVKSMATAIEAAGMDAGTLAARAEELAAALAKTDAQRAAMAQYQALAVELENVEKEMTALDTLTAELERGMRNGATAEQQNAFSRLRMESELLAASQTELSEKLYAARMVMTDAGVSVKNLAAEEARLTSEAATAAAQMDRLAQEAAELKAIADARVQLGIDVDEKSRAELQKTKEAYELLKNSGTLSQEELARATDLHRHQVYELEKSLTNLRPTLADIAAEFQGVATSAAGLTLVSREAVKFESAMASVKKVVDGTPEQIEELESKVKDLAVQFGMMPEAVAEIAAAGGQLGIAVEKLPEFTEITAKMATAFDMAANEAGDAAATIANVFQLPIEQVEELGDAINVLGNNTAARERDIVSAMARIGGTAKQFGLAGEQAAALADAFIALGKAPETASTAINALLQKLQTAQSQGKDFQAALQKIGLSADEMAANIAANPQQALTDFLKKLETLDKQSRALVLSDLFGTQYSDDIALLVGSLGEYEKALALVADKQQVVGAMQREAGNMLGTTEAKINQAKAALAGMASELGGHLLPLISTAADSVGSMAAAISSVSKQFPILTQMAVYYAAARVAVNAYTAVVRIGGVQAVKSLVSQRAAVDSLTASYGRATAAAGGLANTSGGIASLSGGVSKLSGLMGTLAARFALISVASEALIDVNNHLYATSSAARSVMDEIARLPAMLESLWDTGSLEKYRKFYRTSEEMRQELAEAQKKAIYDEAAAAREKAAAAQREVAAVQELQASYRAAVAEQQALAASLATLRAEGAENGALYSDLAVRLEGVKDKVAELKDELNQKNAKLDIDTGALAEAKAALESLGMTAEQVANGIGAESQKTIDAFGKAAAQYGNDAEQMGRIFEAALKKMDGQEATDALRAQLETVGRQAGLTAEEIAKIGEKAPDAAARVAAAFEKIGVDTSAAADGISGKAKQAFSDWQAASEAAAKSSVNDTRYIRQGFENILSKLESKAEFEAFRTQLKRSGDAAKLTQDQLARLNEAAEKGAGAARTAYQGLADSAKNAANSLDLSRVSAAAEAAMQAGTISAAQYEAVLAGVNRRTQEMEAESKKAGEAAEQAHHKAEQAAARHAEVQQTANKAASKSAAAMAQQKTATEQASAAVQDYGLRMSETHGWVKLTTEQMEKFRKVHGGTKLGFEVESSYAAVKAYVEQIANANEAIAALSAASSAGTLNQNLLSRAITATGAAADKLGDTELAKFRAAIDDARDKMESLRRSAQDSTRELQAELDELNGNSEAKYAVQQEQRIAALRQKLQAAQDAGQSDIASEYAKQIDLQNRIYSKQRAERAAKAAESAKSPRSAEIDYNQLAAPTVAVPSVDVTKLTDALAERDKQVARAAADSLIAQLEQAAKRQR